MKAGTAQKMTLNMLSTIAMVKTGHVTGNFMTSMKPTNRKLRECAKFIVAQVCGISEEEAATRRIVGVGHARPNLRAPGALMRNVTL